MHSSKQTEQGPDKIEFCAFYKRNQTTNCCDRGRLCGKQSSLESQASSLLGPIAPENEGRGQCHPKQQDSEM